MLDRENPAPPMSSDSGTETFGSASDIEYLRGCREKGIPRGKMRKSIKRKGLKLREMPSSWANDSGLDFTVNPSGTLSDQDTDAGPDSDAPHSTDLG